MVKVKNLVNRNGACKLSVIIPAFNSEEYIKLSIESVQSQTFRDLEIIIINDGSTDRTEEICKSLAIDDKRIKYFYKNNGGAASARNYGLEKASGEYVHFLDADDILHKKTYEIVVEILERQELEICYFKSTNNMTKLSEKGTLRILSCEEYMKYFFGDKRSFYVPQIGSASMSLIKKDKVKDVRFLEGHTLEDVFYNFKILNHFDRVGVLSSSLYFYNQKNTSSVSTNKSRKRIEDILFVWEMIYKNNDNKNFEKSLKKCLLKAAVVTLYFIYRDKYQEEMNDVVIKCKKIIEGRSKFWLFEKNLKCKHKIFLFAFLLFKDRVNKFLR